MSQYVAEGNNAFTDTAWYRFSDLGRPRLWGM
jgi:hypothetical protein